MINCKLSELEIFHTIHIWSLRIQFSSIPHYVLEWISYCLQKYPHYRNVTREVVIYNVTSLRLDPDYMYYYIHWTRSNDFHPFFCVIIQHINTLKKIIIGLTWLNVYRVHTHVHRWRNFQIDNHPHSLKRIHQTASERSMFMNFIV